MSFLPQSNEVESGSVSAADLKSSINRLQIYDMNNEDMKHSMEDKANPGSSRSFPPSNSLTAMVASGKRRSTSPPREHGFTFNNVVSGNPTPVASPRPIAKLVSPATPSASPSDCLTPSTAPSSVDSSFSGSANCHPSPFKRQRRRYQRRNSATSAMLVSSMSSLMSLPFANEDFNNDGVGGGDVAGAAANVISSRISSFRSRSTNDIVSSASNTTTSHPWDTNVSKAEELVELLKIHRRNKGKARHSRDFPRPPTTSSDAHYSKRGMD